MPRYPYHIESRMRDRLPSRSVEELEAFVNDGGHLSSFYFHLLSGDAFHAASIADGENIGAMGWMLALIAADFPSDCYGSPDAVRAWRGLRAFADETAAAGASAREDEEPMTADRDGWHYDEPLSGVLAPSTWQETRDVSALPTKVRAAALADGMTIEATEEIAWAALVVDTLRREDFPNEAAYLEAITRLLSNGRETN